MHVNEGEVEVIDVREMAKFCSPQRVREKSAKCLAADMGLSTVKSGLVPEQAEKTINLEALLEFMRHCRQPRKLRQDLTHVRRY